HRHSDSDAALQNNWCNMSRGGRGGGRGGFGGKGAFGANNLPPMGLTFADLQTMSREQTALYPPLEPLPVLTEYTDEEKRICELQTGFATRLHKSAYYVVEHTKSTELARYSDKYRPSSASQPTLKRKDLHQPFFPQEIFEDYFNPKKKRKVGSRGLKKRLNLDEMVDDAEEQDKSGDERSEVGSQAAEEDYDVDEEYDNDYAENYFDNGEGDDFDDLGGGGGGDEGGGGGESQLFLIKLCLNAEAHCGIRFTTRMALVEDNQDNSDALIRISAPQALPFARRLSLEIYNRIIAWVAAVAVKEGLPAWKNALLACQLTCRDWLPAARSQRFHRLVLQPSANIPHLEDIYEVDTLVPYVRTVQIHAILLSVRRRRPDADPDCKWASRLVPLLNRLGGQPVDKLLLDWISWGQFTLKLRRCLLTQFTAVTRLMLVDSFPRLSVLRLRSNIWHAATHTPAQLTREVPLVLRKFKEDLPLYRIGLLAQWMIGQRETLIIEDMFIRVNPDARDMARLAALLRKIGPSLKSLRYAETDMSTVLSSDAESQSSKEQDNGEDSDQDERDDEGYDHDHDAIMDENNRDHDAGDKIRYDDTGDDDDMDRVSDAGEAVVYDENSAERETLENTAQLRDDVDQNVEDDPDFSDYRSDEELYERFVAALEAGPVQTPLLDKLIVSILWSRLSTLTLRLFSQMHSPRIREFEMTIEFHNLDEFKSADWNEIDAVLADIVLPYRPESKYLLWLVVPELEGGRKKLEEMIQRWLPRVGKRHVLHVLFDN
ncbi:hypothetical protein A0H81_12322, partial [Grifola frondosa]